MKIAFISYWSCPLTKFGVLASGGMNVYMINLALSLGEMNHQVDIYTRVHKEADEYIKQLNDNVRVIHLSLSDSDHQKNTAIFADVIIKYISQNNLSYDILHAHYYYSGLAALKVGRFINLPVIQTFHTLGELKKRYAGIYSDSRIASERKIVSEVDAIIASTELEKKDLIDVYQSDKGKIFVVHPGVDHDIFRPIERHAARKKLRFAKRQKIILFVGRIDPVKGLTLLVDAVALLSDKFWHFKDNFRVYLIGGDIESKYFWKRKEVKKIKRMITEKHLACCVHFTGSKPYQLLPYYYSACDVIVMPSVYESFGLAVLEAMACSCAVIVSKVGGLKYLVNDSVNGRFFQSGSSRSLAMVLWDLLNDRKQREALGKNGVITSNKFCWDKQAKKTLTVYNKLREKYQKPTL